MVADSLKARADGQGSGKPVQSAILVLISFLSATIFTSCIYSDHPLTARGTKDDRLCGAWRLVDDKNNSNMQLSIEREKDGWYKVSEREQGPGEKEHTAQDRCFPSLTKYGNFLNIEFRVPLKEEDKQQTHTIPKFMFVKYSADKNDLWIWNIDEAVLSVDVHNKRLLGDTDNVSTPWRIIRIHDTPNHMLEYFNDKTNSALFTAAGHFKRI